MTDQNKYTKCVPVDQVAIGMYVSDLDRPWLGSPFLFQGFEITSPEDIRLISETCKHVYIDIKKSKISPLLPDRHSIGNDNTTKNKFKEPAKRTYKTPVAKYYGKQVYVNRCSFDEELKNVGKIYQTTQSTIDQILEGFKVGRNIDITQAHDVINTCVESIFNNKDSLLWFTLIKDCDLYTSQHCLNVTILSIAFGRYLGLSEETLKIVGLCGLLHDVGKVKIPLEILNKEGKFTPEEFAIMKKHPTFGRELLEKQGNIPPEVIDATYGHHERMDGSGYPQGQKGSYIPYYAKLIAITDTYDAITSDRCYQKGRTTFKALGILYKTTESSYDEKLIKSFIQWLGIYPLGSIVEMSNGEVGVVLSVNPDWKTKPRVALLVDEEKNFQPQRIVDLYKNDIDRHGNEYCIKMSHPNNTFGINLNEFQQKSMLREIQCA